MRDNYTNKAVSLAVNSQLTISLLILPILIKIVYDLCFLVEVEYLFYSVFITEYNFKGVFDFNGNIWDSKAGNLLSN